MYYTNMNHIDRILTINSAISEVQISANKTMALPKTYQLISFFCLSNVPVNL